ncbi:MAG: class I SAM-dependent methyltransferase [Leptospiraceae bacterium]|nr:class I SAM-dependent methyltransferase [Leptospiraceae bacterium]MCB1305097.1 class I SAM-dependent methyltransferase [Leptospiraceae bacterium]
MNEYDPQYVAGLFDRMAKTYGVLNYITSFGFSERWRHQCIAAIEQWPKGARVFDLMSGMGEAWPSIARRGAGEIVAIDLSPEMCKRAERNRKRYSASILIRCEDALQTAEPHSADVVVSTFGLKTLNSQQRLQFARAIRNLLKPGGRCSLVEISDPATWILRSLYLFYLKRIIPVLGRLFGGDSHAYGMLGIYTEKFGDCQQFGSFLEAEGIEVKYHRFFFGCATGISGRLPDKS